MPRYSAVVREPVEECRGIDARQLLDALGGLPLGQGHCADLASCALRDALAKISSVVER